MQAFLIMIIEKAGYFGVWLLIAVENIFPPIPSELILTFGGFVTTKASLSLILMILAATLGSVTGALVLYYIGRIMGIEKIRARIDKKGKFMGLSAGDLDKADKWYNRYQKRAVFFCRMVPLVRSLISVPAGMSKMNLPGFIILTAAGSLIWNTVLIFLGAMLGESWPKIAGFMNVYSYITYIVFGVLAVIFVIILLFRKKRKKKAGAK